MRANREREREGEGESGREEEREREREYLLGGDRSLGLGQRRSRGISVFLPFRHDRPQALLLVLQVLLRLLGHLHGVRLRRLSLGLQR